MEVAGEAIRRKGSAERERDKSKKKNGGENDKLPRLDKEKQTARRNL